MIKDVIDELTDCIENYTYVDVLQALSDEESILRKYDSAWSDKVDKVVRDFIANNHDTLYTSVLNECCIVFGLSKKRA